MTLGGKAHGLDMEQVTLTVTVEPTTTALLVIVQPTC